jgi:hypothetical protein
MYARYVRVQISGKCLGARNIQMHASDLKNKTENQNRCLGPSETSPRQSAVTAATAIIVHCSQRNIKMGCVDGCR